MVVRSGTWFNFVPMSQHNTSIYWFQNTQLESPYLSPNLQRLQNTKNWITVGQCIPQFAHLPLPSSVDGIFYECVFCKQITFI